MGVIKFILRLIGWLVTILCQIAMSFLIIFVSLLIFGGVNTHSRFGWLFLLFVVWLGYLIGVNLVGQAALRWVWKESNLRGLLRLIGSAVGALIPLLILLPLGYVVPTGNAGRAIYDLASNNWQPILAEAALFLAIVGFYIPGLLKTNTEPVIME
jgi:hypothetical protein